MSSDHARVDDRGRTALTAAVFGQVATFSDLPEMPALLRADAR